MVTWLCSQAVSDVLVDSVHPYSLAVSFDKVN